ncbi:MAG TPA: cobalamin biosynthesis protein [Methanotrichaceae archaeon]|nr:cobalamin biosynthesis protein [Methanotrichaceae archaeon]
MSGLEIFALAVAFDILVGEPPTGVHPVVWIGKLISALRRSAPVPATRAAGLFVALAVISVTITAGSVLAFAAGYVHPILGALVAAYLLKSTFAMRCLLDTSKSIGQAIDDDMKSAKSMLPALVGRKTESLTPAQARSAVIESLSENYVDSVLSPIFYYLLFEPFGLGLQAALGFKAISTMDSMLGYKTAELKEMGYVPAHLDDIANFIPARLSIFLIALSSPAKAGRALAVALRDHAKTPSPNSGWPMSAAAGALGVRLDKPGYYVLMDEGAEPRREDISRALRLVGTTMALTIIISLLVLVV